MWSWAVVAAGWAWWSRCSSPEQGRLLLGDEERKCLCSNLLPDVRAPNLCKGEPSHLFRGNPFYLLFIHDWSHCFYPHQKGGTRNPNPNPVHSGSHSVMNPTESHYEVPKAAQNTDTTSSCWSIFPHEKWESTHLVLNPRLNNMKLCRLQSDNLITITEAHTPAPLLKQHYPVLPVHRSGPWPSHSSEAVGQPRQPNNGSSASHHASHTPLVPCFWGGFREQLTQWHGTKVAKTLLKCLNSYNNIFRIHVGVNTYMNIWIYAHEYMLLGLMEGCRTLAGWCDMPLHYLYHLTSKPEIQ